MEHPTPSADREPRTATRERAPDREAADADAFTELHEERERPGEAAGPAAPAPGSMPALGYAAYSPTTPLAPFTFTRRALGPHDIQIDSLFCGVCHSDLHTARGEWSGTSYPVVPGHEIVGRVRETGRRVTRFRPYPMYLRTRSLGSRPASSAAATSRASLAHCSGERSRG